MCVACVWLSPDLQACARVSVESWVLRTQRGPPPSNWTPPVASSKQQRRVPSAHPHHAEPYVLSQRHRESKQAVGSQPPAHLTPNQPLPVLFELLLLLLTEGLSQPFNGWTQKKDALPKPWSQITFPLSSVMAERWHCEPDLASADVGNTFLEPLRLMAHLLAIQIEMNLQPPGGQERKRHFLREQPTNWWSERFRLTEGASNSFFPQGTDLNIAWWCH